MCITRSKNVPVNDGGHVWYLLIERNSPSCSNFNLCVCVCVHMPNASLHSLEQSGRKGCFRAALTALGNAGYSENETCLQLRNVLFPI